MRITKQEAYKRINNSGFRIVKGKYINNTTQLLVRCITCKTEFKRAPAEIFAGKRCKYCLGINKKTKEDAIKFYHEHNLIFFLAETFNGVDNKYLSQCQTCLYKWEVSYSKVRVGVICPECTGKRHKTFSELRQAFFIGRFVFIRYRRRI